MAIVKEAKDIYDLQCHICDQNFKNPKVLPCLHSFCHTCLEDTLNNGKVIICPICRMSVPIIVKGIDAFPVSSFANNLLNIIAVQDPTSCTNCEDREYAIARCLDCVENLCVGCVTAHERIRQTKLHKIVTFEELQNNKVGDTIKCPSFCRIHDREILKYFCGTCEDAICRDCALYEHREHNYDNLREAVKTHSVQLNKLLNSTKQKIPELKSSLSDLTKISENLRKRKDHVESIINEAVDYHIQRMEEKRKELLMKVNQITITKNEVLLIQHKRLEFDLDQILSSCEFVDNVMWYGNEAEFMDVKKLMVSRLDELNCQQSQMVPEENDILKFFSNEKNLLTSTDQFGILTTSRAFPPLCVTSEENVLTAKIGFPSTFHIVLKDRFGDQLNKGGDEIAANLTDLNGKHVDPIIIDHNNGCYTVEYNVSSKSDHKLTVHVNDKPIRGSPFQISVPTGIDVCRIGSLLTKFGSTGVAGNGAKIVENYEPWGATCDHADRLIVTDHNNHKIQIFDQNGKLLNQFGSRGKKDGEIWYPTGVAVDRENNIYIADHGNHRVQVFDASGKYLKKIGGRGNIDGLFKGPCGITVDLEDRLIIADRDNHRVQVFSLDGQFLLSIGSYGSSEGKFDSPRHVSITSENDILVSDSNNYRIQRFDRDGNYLSLLGSRGMNEGQFQCPSGLCTDSEDNLIVADFKNLNIQIFNAVGHIVKSISTDDEYGAGLFQKPTSVCVSSSGNLFVTDRGTRKIYLF